MLISRKKSTIRHRHVRSTIFYTHDNPSSEQPSIQKRYLQCTREKREISRETVLVSCETSLVSCATSLVSRDTSLVSREKVVTYIWAVLYALSSKRVRWPPNRKCKVTKESSGANKITRNAIDFTSITLWWTSSSSWQSVFSTTSDGSQRSLNGGESLRSVCWWKLGTFARIKKVIWDQLLATKAEIIQS